MLFCIVSHVCSRRQARDCQGDLPIQLWLNQLSHQLSLEFCTRLVGWCKWWCSLHLVGHYCSRPPGRWVSEIEVWWSLPILWWCLTLGGWDWHHGFLLLRSVQLMVESLLSLNCYHWTWYAVPWVCCRAARYLSCACLAKITPLQGSVMNQLVLVFHGMSLVGLFHAAEMSRAWR